MGWRGRGIPPLPSALVVAISMSRHKLTTSAPSRLWSCPRPSAQRDCSSISTRPQLLDRMSHVGSSLGLTPGAVGIQAMTLPHPSPKHNHHRVRLLGPGQVKWRLFPGADARSRTGRRRSPSNAYARSRSARWSEVGHGTFPG
jgi:hypothetical protein